MARNEVRMNVRVYLSVPYSEKEEAKALGCRWDSDRKKWYCIDSNYGKSNISDCLELWGEDAYKIINGETIMIDEIHPHNRGYTS